MKFVCMKCETFMHFQKVEKPGDDSLGVMFECASCGSRVAMVTNPGETQMVSALGVKLGGRTTEPEPFELTRGTLKESVQAPISAQAPAPPKTDLAAAVQAEAGKCPFSSMLAGMKEGVESKITWSPEAEERMEKIPDFVKPMVKMGIEAFAKKQGYQVITPKVIDESKNDQAGFEWTPGATQKLVSIIPARCGSKKPAGYPWHYNAKGVLARNHPLRYRFGHSRPFAV